MGLGCICKKKKKPKNQKQINIPQHPAIYNHFYVMYVCMSVIVIVFNNFLYVVSWWFLLAFGEIFIAMVGVILIKKTNKVIIKNNFFLREKKQNFIIIQFKCYATVYDVINTYFCICSLPKTETLLFYKIIF